VEEHPGDVEQGVHETDSINQVGIRPVSA
jgi:hypothetical protein